MHDRDIESLLRRYRPMAASHGLGDRITQSPNRQITKSDRTWPWAVAAAALLAISVGLHATVPPAPDTSPLVDAQRVQAIADELGGSPESQVMAEWIVRQEARAERDAESARARASVQEFDRQ
jgi:hypothetical protein